MSIYKNGLSILDPKWTHPELRDAWMGEPEGTSANYMRSVIRDESKTPQERSNIINGLIEQWLPKDDDMDPEVERLEYTAPGCPEEPETSVAVWVYRKKKASETPSRVMFFTAGGGLRSCFPQSFDLPHLCKAYDCIVVTPIFRPSLLGRYPAQLNDCHAAYQWMMNNAETLHADIHNVVLCGSSSGGHLATVLPFRLKRYGFECPKGVVVENPVIDDRQKFAAARLRDIQLSGLEYKYLLEEICADQYGDALLTPEFFANRAEVEDLVGYPPVFIHTAEFDPGRDDCREFIGKVHEAGTYGELHVWGGMEHGIADALPLMFASDVKRRVQTIIEGNTLDCFRYDLRRPWVAYL